VSIGREVNFRLPDKSGPRYITSSLPWTEQNQDLLFAKLRDPHRVYCKAEEFWGIMINVNHQ
jgi:hypothetical protein